MAPTTSSEEVLHAIHNCLANNTEEDVEKKLTNDPLRFASAEEGDEALYDVRSSYDITVKLFLLDPNETQAHRAKSIECATDAVCQSLAVQDIDLIIVAFGGVEYDGNESMIVSKKQLSEWSATYRQLEKLQMSGYVQTLGLADFGITRLNALLPTVHVRPKAVQINVKHCCTVPTEMIQYAREQNLELLAHDDPTDILPANEFRDTLFEYGYLDSDNAEVRPIWVAKYTAIAKDRGVVERKGYVLSARVG